jgi:sulfur carrier protein
VRKINYCLPEVAHARNRAELMAGGGAMTSSAEIVIQLNGEPYTVLGDARIGALIERLKLKRGRVAVELNQAVVPKAEWDSVEIRPGDKIEIVNFVGGG